MLNNLGIGATRWEASFFSPSTGGRFTQLIVGNKADAIRAINSQGCKPLFIKRSYKRATPENMAVRAITPANAHHLWHLTNQHD